MKKHLKSEKGAAIITISIIVAAIVMLTILLVSENLRSSLLTLGLQKQSLIELYKAEEGIEYAYFTTKNDVDIQENDHGKYMDEAPFKVSLWKDGEEITGDDNTETLLNMRVPGEGEYIISSENIAEDDNVPKKTIFTRNPFITAPEPEPEP